MNIYTEKQYIDMIKDFFKNFSDRALLIEGEWGSGKTYFIKNKFKESLNENDVLIYISLYGMSTTENIDTYYIDSILKEEYIKRFPKKVGANASIKLFEVLKKSNTILDVLMNKKDFTSIFQKNRNYYIVLDDLERCTIDLPVLLGFINHLTEQKNNNVLVIANENEIGKSNVKSDIAQKYITSLLAKNIEIEEPILFNKDNKFSDIKTLDQLNLKSDAIFNNDINWCYSADEDLNLDR